MAKSESKNAGFIFLHRSIRDHWVWKDPVKFQWWVDILMECNHSDQKVSIGYSLMECKRGQSLNSLLTWANSWRVDVSSVRRFFKLLQDDQMIVTENILKSTRLTVCNYDIYNNISTPAVFKNGIRKGSFTKNETETVPNADQKATGINVNGTVDYADPRQSKQSQNNSETIPTQSQRNSDAIQTKNELKNDTKNDKEFFSGYSPQQIKDFEKFEKWILEHTPRVAKMKEPFTIKNFLALREKITGAEISEFLERMHNYEKLLANNRSANLTILSWIKKDKQNGTHQQSLNGHAKKLGTSEARIETARNW